MIACLLPLLFNGFANAGQERKGGDADRIHMMTEQDIIQFVQFELRQELSDLVEKGRIDPIYGIKNLIDSVTNNSSYLLTKNIREIPYNFREKCTDDRGIEHAASYSSKRENSPGEICFNARKLFDQGATPSKLVGLTFHEHAHHFGFEDRSHGMAETVANAYEQYLKIRDYFFSFYIPLSQDLTSLSWKGSKEWGVVRFYPEDSDQIQLPGSQLRVGPRQLGNAGPGVIQTYSEVELFYRGNWISIGRIVDNDWAESHEIVLYAQVARAREIKLSQGEKTIVIEVHDSVLRPLISSWQSAYCEDVGSEGYALVVDPQAITAVRTWLESGMPYDQRVYKILNIELEKGTASARIAIVELPLTLQEGEQLLQLEPIDLFLHEYFIDFGNGYQRHWDRNGEEWLTGEGRGSADDWQDLVVPNVLGC